MTHTFNVLPTRPADGVAEMLLALGEARIEVHRVAAEGDGFIVSLEEPAHSAEHILEALGYRVERPAFSRRGASAA